MISRLLGALLLNALLVPSLPAVTVDGLNSATVPVADRSVAESERGIGEAFRQVIIKLSGSRQTLEQAGIRQLLGKARNFVTVQGQAGDGNATDGFRLRVDFDAAALGAALRERGVSPWSRDRPLTGVWLAVEDASGRRFSPDAQTEPSFRALTEAAARRGLPIDRRVPTNAPATGTPAALFDALLGPAPAPDPAGLLATPLLAGLLKQGPAGEWVASFRWRVEAETADWTGQGVDPLALVGEAVDRATEAVAARYAASPGGDVAARAVRLNVGGLRSAADYGRVMALLRGFDIVDSLTVAEVSGEAVEVALVARGGLPALVQSIRLSGQLTPAAEGDKHWTLAAHD